MTFTRYKLTLDLELTSELHIGGVDKVPERDGEGTLIRFCRNGLGEPTIPGRSIRGAVRTACDATRKNLKAAGDSRANEGGVFSDAAWESLWGDDSAHTGKSHGEIGLPQDAVLPIRRSALTFQAVSFANLCNTELPKRHSVGIDRATGAASKGALYEHEFLPRGTRFTAVITAEGRDNEEMTHEQSKGIPGPASTDAVKKLLGLIVSILDSSTVTLGGRTGSGQGTVKLENHDLQVVSKTTDKKGKNLSEVVDALVSKEEGPREEDTGNEEDKGRKQKKTDDKDESWPINNPVRVTIKWWSPTGIFVAEDKEKTKRRKAAAEEEQRAKSKDQDPCDNKVSEVVEPLRTSDNAQLLIPGTSIRGALRSRASRIARTVLASRPEYAPQLAEYATQDIHEQIAREPNLVRYLFGTTEYRGAVTVHDCVSTNTLGKRIEVTHNAIDRWTGGVIDGKLFTEAIYLGTKWKPILIDIDLRQLLTNIKLEGGTRQAIQKDDASSSSKKAPTDADYARAAYILLGLVLGELAAGSLPLGGRSTRGMGQVLVTSIDVKGTIQMVNKDKSQNIEETVHSKEGERATLEKVEIPTWSSTNESTPTQQNSPHRLDNTPSHESQHTQVKQLLKHLRAISKELNNTLTWVDCL